MMEHYGEKNWSPLRSTILTLLTVKSESEPNTQKMAENGLWATVAQPVVSCKHICSNAEPSLRNLANSSYLCHIETRHNHFPPSCGPRSSRGLPNVPDFPASRLIRLDTCA